MFEDLRFRNEENSSGQNSIIGVLITRYTRVIRVLGISICVLLRPSDTHELI